MTFLIMVGMEQGTVGLTQRWSVVVILSTRDVTCQHL